MPEPDCERCGHAEFLHNRFMPPACVAGWDRGSHCDCKGYEPREEDTMGHEGEPGADPAPPSTRHTPGPWTRAGTDGFGIFAGHECIASVHAAPDENEAERKANARLIVAGPNMLKALVTIVRSADHNGSPGWHEIEAAREAIEAAS